MTDEEQEFATKLAEAIAGDLHDHPAEGALVRIVVRWEDEGHPLELTVHALGADEREEIEAEWAWNPMEWPDVDRELERVDRVLGFPGLQQAGEALKAQHDAEPDEADEPRSPLDGDEPLSTPVAVVEAVRELTDALLAVDVSLADDFAATAAHYEGWGALKVLEEVAEDDVLATLEAQDELPVE